MTALLAVAIGLGACSMQSSRLALLEAPLHDAPVAETQSSGVEAQQESDVEQHAITVKPVASGPDANSHWCRYLQEDAAAEATVVRSPSLNGSIDDNGRASLGMGVSLTSYMKADLIESSAEAKCRRYLAEKGLQSVILSSPAGLSSAGFRAKAAAILGREAEIRSLRGTVQSSLADGTTDQQHASSILLLADQLMADGLAAKSQAAMRMDTLQSNKHNVAALSAELAKAESDISEADSQMRSYDAFDVSLRAGWNDDVNDQGVQVRNDDLSGKVTFSMKLGAMVPSRFEHEQAAKAAKIAAIKSEEGGVIWQATALRQAYERSIAGLEESQAKIIQALARTRNFENQLAAEGSPEFAVQQAGARLQAIKLSAERDAIIATLEETRSTLAQLGPG